MPRVAVSAFAYTVRITLPRGEAFAAWVAWLSGEHVAHVCAAGAIDAEIVVLDAPDASESATSTVECRYRFASREAFATYEREHAPRLRADGVALLARFGLAPGDGATFTRETGEIRPYRR